MINSNHTLYEIVSGKAKSKSKPKQGATGATKPLKKQEKHMASHPKKNKPAPVEEAFYEDDDGVYDDGDGDPCPACGGHYKQDEFWIACDACETWFHGKCVKVCFDKPCPLAQPLENCCHYHHHHHQLHHRNCHCHHHHCQGWKNEGPHLPLFFVGLLFNLWMLPSGQP